MTTITIRTADKAGFTAEGHAGSGNGNNIVCAAVSALTQSAALGLMHYRPLDTRIKDGNGYLSVELHGNTDPVIVGILQTMKLGLLEIEKQYPDKVNVIE